ncbi:S8 family serine peptidase [Balamuthia mandrillaris]
MASAWVFIATLGLLLFPVLISAVRQAPAPLHRGEKPVPNSYVIKMKSDVDSSKATDYLFRVATRLNATREARAVERSDSAPDLLDLVRHVYSLDAFQGFSAKLSQGELEKIMRDDEVEYIEEDQFYEYQACVAPSANGHHNLDRLDNSPPNWDGVYRHEAKEGDGVVVYVLDSGIRTSHHEFGPPPNWRAAFGANIVEDGYNSDCHGHGTHVAGTIAGYWHGVAKKARVVAVKIGSPVYDCSSGPTLSNIINGICWATNDHRIKGLERSVANLSSGGPPSATMCTAIQASHDAGIVWVVAAGNDNSPVSSGSPYDCAAPIVVGNAFYDPTTQQDFRASTSNYGSNVHLFAPGEQINSSAITSDTAVRSFTL